MTDTIDIRETVGLAVAKALGAEPAGSRQDVSSVVPNRAAKRLQLSGRGMHKPNRSRCTRGAKKRGVRKLRGE